MRYAAALPARPATPADWAAAGFNFLRILIPLVDQIAQSPNEPIDLRVVVGECDQRHRSG
jgi:hypothetical protein